MENSTDSKINQARSDVHAVIDKVAAQVPPATDRLATQAHNGVDKVADNAESASGHLVARGKQLAASCRNLTESSRNQVRANPVISVLVAAAAGYGLSRLLGSRHGK